MTDNFFSLGDDELFSKNELSANANGGTELMLRNLYKYVDNDLLNNFYIICSRVRDIHPTKKNILWLHDLWNDGENFHLQDSASRQRFAKMIFVSNYQRTTFQHGYGILGSESTILQNAIEPIDMTGINKTTPEVVNLIYHTTPHRGLELLVPAYMQLSEHFGDRLHLQVYSSFKIYGWEARDADYQTLFDICKEHPHITYHGSVSNEEVREALKHTHIFAYPSIWQETSCIAAMEAMSAKNIVVCPSHAALAETCNNFAVMYDWHEDPAKHYEMFAYNLFTTIEKLLEGDSNDMFLNYIKNHTDSFNGWELRSRQWKNTLQHLLATSG